MIKTRNQLTTYEKDIFDLYIKDTKFMYENGTIIKYIFKNNDTICVTYTLPNGYNVQSSYKSILKYKQILRKNKLNEIGIDR